jgi:hypothetical protein
LKGTTHLPKDTLGDKFELEKDALKIQDSFVNA